MSALKILKRPRQASDPKWMRTTSGRFHRLARLDPDELGLSRVGGVYVVWHAGIRPQWLYVGRTDDLAATFRHLAKDGDVADYEVHGGVYVTWSLIRSRFRSGVVRYLNETLEPLIPNPNVARDRSEPVPVLLPGAKLATSE